MYGLFRVSGKGWGKAVRLALLLGVFAVCAWAFQAHFTRRFASIEARNAFWDETGLTRPEDRAALDEIVGRLRERWGLRVSVHIRKGAVPAPEDKPKGIFVGVSPGRRQALVLLPPLVKKAVPSNFTFQLENRLDACTEEHPAALCAAETLEFLDRTLREN